MSRFKVSVVVTDDQETKLAYERSFPCPSVEQALDLASDLADTLLRDRRLAFLDALVGEFAEQGWLHPEDDQGDDLDEVWDLIDDDPNTEMFALSTKR